MKNILFLLLTTFCLIACNKNDSPLQDTEQSSETAQGGKADITLTASGENYKINGPCGWASAMDTHYIGANDSSNNLKTFSVFFNLDELPSQTTTYKLVKDQNDTESQHVWMNITEMRNQALFEYTSDDNSGELKLVVDGNKVTVDLAGIVLQPGTNEFFENLNKDAFGNPGTLSGTLVFYKN